MDALLALDRQLFLVMNGVPHTPPLDSLALLLSGVGVWGIVWFILGLAFLAARRSDPRYILPLFTAGLGSWILVEVLLKPLFARPRPIQADTFAFPSGHATTAWAMAVVLAHKERRWRWAFFALAALISLSRMYLGLHYPLDVVGGALLGWGIGHLVLRLHRSRI